MRKWLMLVAITALGGCGTTKVGNERILDDQTVSKIQMGKSTKADVKTLLGDPTKVSFTGTSEGEEDWDYVYSEGSVKGSTYVPYYGLFKGGMNLKQNTLTIRFSKDGIAKQLGRGKSDGGGGAPFSK